IMVIFYLAYMIYLSPQLSLFLLLFLPFSGLLIGRIGRSLKKVSKKVQEKLCQILSTIEESLSLIRVIKAFNAEKQQSKRFNSENAELFIMKNKANRR